mmetsp:Transcript_7824/g.7374  ORF Transcript_7824/g.7374 Transcript_7824/m.7374 type:complete len:101 (+) Transcript_7824:63-365(+)
MFRFIFITLPLLFFNLVRLFLFSRWNNRSTEKQEEGRTYPNSNPRNNHDDSKHKHASAKSAEAEVERMQRNDYEDSDRLNVYYNKQLKGFFVGKRQGKAL